MHHDAAVIQNGPAAFPLALRTAQRHGVFCHKLIHKISKGSHLGGGPSAGNHKIIAENGQMGNVQDDNILCLFFVQKGCQLYNEFLILHECPPYD